ncbi:hypothetical protein [Micromonospora fluostatini]|uniref:hypothetical protein n=1 Tax=Micromonospora sp. JCM 30529 TaxID=3421643 RepID=UPI003D177B8C
MGILYDYFTAASDEDAAATIDLPGGPGGAEPARPGLMEALRAGDQEAIRRLARVRMRLSEHGLNVLSVKGIDPVVQVATLEELLTGVDTETLFARPRAAALVAERFGGEQLVLTLADETQRALAELTPQRAAEVADPWSRTEEFGGYADPEALAEVVGELARLARHADEQQHRLYCWVCV